MPDLTEQLRALEGTALSAAALLEQSGGFVECQEAAALRSQVSALLAAADTPIPMNSEYAEQRIAEGVERDAARYRWLREHDNADLLAEDVIDEAIDSMRDSGEGRE